MGPAVAEPVSEERPTRRQRYLFWIILSCLSAFFAEVISGSYPFPFTTPWGLIMVIPLYGLHTLVLAFVVFKVGRPRFSTLFIAGCIFGMYEAYITKVLWNPPWGEAPVKVGGVAIVELGVISFCWHPFMAFLVPLAVALTLTSSRGMLEAMPGTIAKWLRHREWHLLVALAIWGGLVMGSQVTPHVALLANVVAMVVLGILLHVFMRSTGGRHSMEALLPDGKEVRYLLGALLVYYAIAAPLFVPEALPDLGPQLGILAIYAVLFLLLKRSIDQGKARGPVPAWRPALDRSRTLRLFAIYTAATLGTSVIALLIGPVFLFLSWFAWALIAIMAMGFSVRDVLGGRTQGTGEPPPAIRPRY